MTLKRKAALEMLEAQKVIERIEAESVESVQQSMILSVRFQSYHAKDASLDRRFIATISISDAQVRTAPHAWHEYFILHIVALDDLLLIISCFFKKHTWPKSCIFFSLYASALL